MGKKALPRPSGRGVTVVQTGDVQELAFKKGMTAVQALDKAGISGEALMSEGLQVRLNNVITTDLDIPLRKGDRLTVVGDIAGA